MYIKSANIFGFGKLVDQRFEFHKDYQVIRGLNESGKTTLLAFIKAILFEFESGKNKYEQYIPKNASKYGGELVLVDGNDEWLIRRVKGKTVAGDVSIYKDGTQFPESVLKDLLKNVNKQLFNSAYVLNQKNFNSLDQLKRDELIEDILTVGAVGGTEWLQLVKQLDKDAGDIYRSSKNAKKPLNLALKDYDKLVKEQAELQSQKTEYLAKKQQFEQINNETQQLKAQHDDFFKNLNQQQSVISKRNEYEEYLRLNEELSKQKGQDISNDDWDKFKILDEQIKSIKSNLNNSTMELNKLSESEEIQLNNYNLNKESIEKIHTDLDDISRKEFNIEQLQSEISNLEDEKSNLLSANDKLAENMTPLTELELTRVNDALRTKDTAQIATSLYIAMGLGIIALLSLLLPGMTKAIAIIFAAGAGYFGYSYFSNKNKQSQYSIEDEYWSQHNYRQLTPEQVIMWQPQIVQLQNISNKLVEAKDQFTAEKRELDTWNRQVNNLNIVEIPNVKSVHAYFEQINYLQKKEQDLSVTSRQVTEKNKELSQKSVELTQQQLAIINKYQMNSVDDFVQRRSIDLQLQDQIKRRDVLKESLDNSLLSKISENAQEFDRLTTELTFKQEQLSETELKLNESNNQLAQLQVEMNNLANDDDYLRLEKAINDKKTEVTEFYDEWVSQKLGAKWAYKTLNLASSNRFPKMIERTNKYFNIMTNGNYIEVIFDENTIDVQSFDAQKFNLNELSRGTMAQLFIALRCAFVMEISDLVKLPILIDDAFNDFDKERYESAVKLIKSMSEENQIFYIMTNNMPADSFSTDHIIDLGGHNGK